jgi:hypothetical protein
MGLYLWLFGLLLVLWSIREARKQAARRQRIDRAGAASAWRRGVGDGRLERAVIARLRIAYSDGLANHTERDIDVWYCLPRLDSIEIQAFCRLRNDGRTFVLHRIIWCADRETGELMDDPGLFFAGLADIERSEAPRYSMKLHRVLCVLAYVARADGRFNADERTLIMDQSAALCGLETVPPDMIDSMLRKRGYFGDIQSLDVALREIRMSGVDMTMLYNCAAAVVATGRTVKPEEAAALEAIRVAV